MPFMVSTLLEGGPRAQPKADRRLPSRVEPAPLLAFLPIALIRAPAVPYDVRP
jgi:hypothetical protein